MLGWMFNKKTEMPATAAAPVPAAASPNPAAAQGAAQAQGAAPAQAVWPSRLAAATGDDAALLEIAKLAPSIDVKCAAIAALTDEAALKQAEREFRTHDRRVHRAAKQRLEAAVAQRLARERAAQLIQSATALLAETTIPTNRLVELDRAWQALDATLLEDAQRTGFASLSAQLTELTRERGERALQAQRWTTVARQALQQLNAVGADVAAGTTDRTELASAAAAAQALRQTVPGDGELTALDEALRRALEQAAHVQARLNLLEAFQPPSPPAAPAEGPPPAADAMPSPLDRWQALASIADPQVAAALNQRFEQSQASLAAAQRAAPAQMEQQRNALRQAATQAAQHQRAQTVAPLLQQAEAALAAGNLAETHQHLVAIDAAVGDGAVPEALRGRLNALHAEYARLKGWQHWGGGRARDDLVQEAQTLATATAAAVADPRQAAKLPVKQLADAIDDLRKRWKELDRLGGATNQTLWHAFDAALKAAHEPVAAHQGQLKARRKENLDARLQLIAALDAAGAGTGTPVIAQDDAHDDAPADAQELRTDWKEQVRALDQFQMEWRKLGPVEHTVPHKARDKLMERMQASVARVEAPLQEARRAAQTVRERLVARAKALSAEAIADPRMRELIARVRELQDTWQQHARTLPLTRQVETALWSEFKSATDAVFAQRDAAASVFDAQLLANQAAREALAARLEALTADTPAPELKRALSEAEAEWRTAVDVPRSQVAALDSRYRVALQTAQKYLADSAQRGWRTRCDALGAKLALCEALESSTAAGVPAAALVELAARWAAQAPLPPPWEQALASRWRRGSESAPAAAPPHAADGDDALNSVLLQLESALDAASPPAFQTARRDMKLRAMKAALEGKRAAGAVNPSVDELTAAALAHPHPLPGQRERLSAILAALRAKGPGNASAPVSASSR
jgi:DNA repair protein SbcC/Rad50